MRQAGRRSLLALLHPRPVPARLSSDEVAKAVPLAANAHSLLDVAGAHGEFSMALCRRHPGLKATVVDLPGSARIGREIVSGAGMEDRVRHLEGDMLKTEAAPGGALSASTSSTTSPPHRSGRSLTPVSRGDHAPVARSACSISTAGRRADTPDSSSILGLFFHLTSGADTYTVEQVSTWLGNPAARPRESRPSAPCRADDVARQGRRGSGEARLPCTIRFRRNLPRSRSVPELVAIDACEGAV